MSKYCVVIFYEGDTEEEFYKKLVQQIREYNGGKLDCKVKPINVKGIGNYKKRVLSLYEKRIIPKYEEFKHIVILCYDYDVFEFSKNPPVDMDDVKEELLKLGADKVYFVVAKNSIEDWFLKDPQGVLKYLRHSNGQKIPDSGTGVDKLKKLFKQSNKTYLKGKKSIGFVDSLNIPVIMHSICNDIKPICNELGIDCSAGDKCK